MSTLNSPGTDNIGTELTWGATPPSGVGPLILLLCIFEEI